MIRIVFDAGLNMTDPVKAKAAVEKIGAVFKDVVAIPHANGQMTIIVRSTDMQAYDFMTIHMTKAKNFVLCDGCQSVHFKTEENVKDVFRCPCGKVLNKTK